MKRILREKTSTVEVAISKCLCGGRLFPSEIEELRHMTQADLMSEHGLDSLLSEKVMTHLRAEVLRQGAQSLQTYKVTSRDGSSAERLKPSPVNPISESASLYEDLNFELEDITDMSHHHTDDGRMLDYGHVKSDSHEGRMMRQALYELSEYSGKLHDMLSDDDDLPQWCHYKVAIARNYIGKVRHYLEYKISHPKKK